MNSKKVRFLVALWVFLFVISGIIGIGQTLDLVENLETGETFSSIKAAIEDSDTDEGDTIVVHPVDQHFQRIEMTKETKDNLTLKSQDIPNRPTIEETAKTVDGTSYKIITEGWGIHLIDSNANDFQHFHLAKVSSLTDADISDICGSSSTCSGDVYAGALSYGIQLENSSGNAFQHIDMSEIQSKATATADSGDAEAIADAYGISLKNSSGNTFQYIDLNDISGQASASTKSGEEYIEVNTYGVDIDDSSDNTFKFNVIGDNKFGVWNNSTGTTFHYNNIVDNTRYGVKNSADVVLDASLNWWGSDDGPRVDMDSPESNEFDPEYNGGGDRVWGSVAFSPWIIRNPDANLDKPGVQLIDPLPMIVEKVGPAPTTENGNTGYLDMAIWGASSVLVRGKIIVPHGTYQAKEPLGNNAELISVDGTTCHTCLEEVEGAELTIDGNDITVGKLDGYTPRGFIIKDDVEVKSGVDASTVSLNWNDLRKTVSNSGQGTLNAEYNWWGDLDPSDSISSEVDYRPFLPEGPCDFTDYMEKHGLTTPREGIVNKSSEGETCSTDLPKKLIVKYRLKPDEAEKLVYEHDCYDVRKALEKAEGNFDVFKSALGVTNI